MAKHVEHEEHENHERWLVSYADFITLLFAFFVVMYAISSVDSKRAIQVEKAVRWALHIAGNGGGGDRILVPDGSLPGARALDLVPLQSAQRDKNVFDSARSRMQKKLAASAGSGARPAVLVLLEGRRMILRVSGHGLFDEGGSAIRPSAFPTLDVLFAEAERTGGNVRIEGHTDSSGVSGAIDGNWLLSAERAASVAAYATSAKLIPSRRLSLAGYGSQRPIADNGTEEGREQNRRIDIVVELAPPDPPPPTPRP